MEMLFHDGVKSTWLSSTNRNVIFGPMLNSPVCLDLSVEKISMGNVLHLMLIMNTLLSATRLINAGVFIVLYFL